MNSWHTLNYVEYSANDDSEEEQETIASAEWIQNSKNPVTCPFGKKEPESYGFDITKADKIFDLLLSEGLIKLKPYHKIPSEDELKNMKYCKCITPRRKTPMSAKSSDSRSRWLSSKGG